MMKGSTKKTMFMFSHLDYKAMQEYFEQMARKGWMLEKLGTVTATFRQIEPQDLTFTVDIFPYTTIFDSPENQDAMDYRELCEQSGWRFVTSSNKLNVFFAKAKEDPTPIQTDSVVEEKLVRQSVFSAELLVFIICLPLLWLRMGSLFPFDYSKLFTNMDIVATVYFPLLLIPVTLYTGYYVWWFWKARRNIREGLPLPQTSLRAARFRGLLLLYVAGLLVVLMFAAAIADARGGRAIILYVMFLPLISIAGSLWLKKTVATKRRTRRQNMAMFAIASIGITFVFITTMNVLIFAGDRFPSWTGMKRELPDGYIALKLTDFGINRQPHTTSFSQSSSFLVPQSYDYYESSQDGVIRTRYIEAVNQRVARYIFDGMLKRSDLLYNRHISPAPSAMWNADEAYYLTTDRSMLILIQGSRVIYLDSKFDFAEKDLVEISGTVLQLN